ncbi:MAG: glycosyltransferase [Chthoniobacterales bacterium]
MRVVFASLGSLGDLHPLLALARAAGERGHDPVIAASTGYRDYVESLGFEFHAIRPDFEFEPKLVARLFDPKRGPERLMREQIFPNVRKTYADLLDATQGADLLVVGELLYVAPLVAAAHGIPWANAILAPTSFLSACDPCVLAPVQRLFALRRLGRWPYRLIFALGRIVTRRWSAPLTAFRKELGFPDGTSPVFDAKHSPLLTLALFPKFLAAPQSDWPPHVVQTGFPFFAQSIRPDAAVRLKKFLAAGEPPVVFTLGSSVIQIARDFFQCAAGAAQQAGRRAILLTGGNPIPPGLPDAILAIDYVPLDEVVPHAVALVHQGGVGTCAEALRWGVPSLVIPFGFDQPDNAERLRRLGVAAVLPRARFSQDRLTAVLTELLASAPMAGRARELAAGMQPEHDMEKSLDAIERLVGAGRKSRAVQTAVR